MVTPYVEVFESDTFDMSRILSAEVFFLNLVCPLICGLAPALDQSNQALGIWQNSSRSRTRPSSSGGSLQAGDAAGRG